MNLSLKRDTRPPRSITSRLRVGCSTLSVGCPSHGCHLRQSRNAGLVPQRSRGRFTHRQPQAQFAHLRGHRVGFCGGRQQPCEGPGEARAISASQWCLHAIEATRVHLTMKWLFEAVRPRRPRLLRDDRGTRRPPRTTPGRRDRRRSPRPSRAATSARSEAY